MRRFAPACLAIAVTLGAVPSPASLPDDIERLTERWGKRARVRRLAPRLLTHGERIPIVLPSGSRGALDSPGCTTLAVLGSVSVSFAVHRSTLGANAFVGDSAPSVAGAVEIVRCGRQRVEQDSLWVEMRSPRGVVEFVVAQSDKRLPSLRQELPHRDPGPASPESEAGPRPISPPLKARATDWEAQAKREGALQAASRVLNADERSRVGLSLELEPGCHRISALGLQPAQQDQSIDIDLAVYRDPPRGLVREDQSENPDATLSLCVAETAPVFVDVIGIPAGDPVVLLTARFPLPEGLPVRWGPSARERLAEALWEQHYPGVSAAPVYESLGVTGITLLPFEVEPNTCYVVAGGVLRGLVKGFQMRMLKPGGQVSAGASSERPSSALAFCTGVEREAKLQVDAFGASLAWLVSVWRSEGAVTKERAP